MNTAINKHKTSVYFRLPLIAIHVGVKILKENIKTKLLLEASLPVENLREAIKCCMHFSSNAAVTLPTKHFAGSRFDTHFCRRCYNYILLSILKHMVAVSRSNRLEIFVKSFYINTFSLLFALTQILRGFLVSY